MAFGSASQAQAKNLFINIKESSILLKIEIDKQDV